MARLRTTFQAGKLIKKSITNAIRSAAFQFDVNLKLEEIGSTWFETEYGMEVNGSDERIMVFKRWWEKFIKEFS